MAVIFINGQELEIGDEERINGIQAAKRLGIEIPHYCWHPGLSVVASCRMCLVETGRRDPNTGVVSLLPKLVPACQTPAVDGTVFVTDSDKVQAARALGISRRTLYRREATPHPDCGDLEPQESQAQAPNRNPLAS